MDFAEVSAHVEIRQVLATYCRGVDRGDADLIRSVYHDDSFDDHGRFVGNGHDFADYIVPRLDSVGICGQHHITNVYIELNGSSATVESYLLSWRASYNEIAKEHQLVPISGRYLDVFENRGDGWKIARRKVLVDWICSPLTHAQLTSEPNCFPKNGRREQDPSWSFFKGEPAHGDGREAMPPE